MADFVINEWFWSDLSGDNGLESQRESFRLIEIFPRLEHRIVIIEGSAFDQKAWSLCGNTKPMIVQRLAGAFVKNIRQSDRCLILKPDIVGALPPELIPRIKLDDYYLVQAQLTVGGAILVTTDTPLREAVTGLGLECQAREEFLRQHVLNLP